MATTPSDPMKLLAHVAELSHENRRLRAEYEAAKGAAIQKIQELAEAPPPRRPSELPDWALWIAVSAVILATSNATVWVTSRLLVRFGASPAYPTHDARSNL